MNTYEILDELQKKAKKDPELRSALINTKQSTHPLEEFCSICRSVGYSIYPMDLIDAGESMYAAMKRSTNGGGENSPMLDGQDDF